MKCLRLVLSIAMQTRATERSIPAGQSLLELSKPTVAGSKGSDISAELARWKVEQPTWDGTQ